MVKPKKIMPRYIIIWLKKKKKIKKTILEAAEKNDFFMRDQKV